VDGLDLVRRVAADAPRWLARGGCLLVETSERQAPTAVEAFARVGLIARLAVSEERYANVVIGVKP
jgi:release factor glutamine methyltransferase